MTVEVETVELRRLRWRCRRGLLELDILLLRFLDQGYSGLDVSQRQAFSDLLELPDNTLLAYLNNLEQPDDLRLSEMVNFLQ
ncbi:MAG: succinate dehydrogenase assembly factor 2 [Acidiferrobacterales bacterium]